MPPLNNHRWERFALLLFQGLDQLEAYREAGYKRPRRNNASTLANKAEVLERLQELEDARSGEVVAEVAQRKTAGGVLDDIVAIADQDPGEIVRLDEGSGEFYVHAWNDLPARVRKCVRKITQTRGVTGNSTFSIEMYSRQDALKELTKLLGLNKVDPEASGGIFLQQINVNLLRSMDRNQLEILRKVLNTPELESLRDGIIPLLMRGSVAPVDAGAAAERGRQPG